MPKWKTKYGQRIGCQWVRQLRCKMEVWIPIPVAGAGKGRARALTSKPPCRIIISTQPTMPLVYYAKIVGFL